MSLPLPQITHPTFEMTVPSSGKKHQSRPMQTRERKALLMALESGEPTAVSSAVRSICSACISDLQADVLTTFDLEWAFLQLVINSIKDTIDLEVRIPRREAVCQDCGKSRTLKVDLRQAKLDGSIRDKKSLTIEISPELGIKLKYPSDKDVEMIELVNKDKKEVEKLIDMISVSIESVFDSDKTYAFSEYSYEEKIAWLESLPTQSMDELEAFVSNIPRLVLDVKIECPKCSFVAVHRMKGLSDFFV